MRNINRINDYFVGYILCSIIINEDAVDCFNEVHNLEIINIYNLHKNINLKDSVFDFKAITNVYSIKKNKILSCIKALCIYIKAKRDAAYNILKL